MPSTDHQHVVQALSPDSADQPIRVIILPGQPWGYESVADPLRPDSRDVDVPIGSIIVTHQEAWRLLPREGLGDLAGQPLCHWMPYHLEPQ